MVCKNMSYSAALVWQAPEEPKGIVLCVSILLVSWARQPQMEGLLLRLLLHISVGHEGTALHVGQGSYAVSIL